MAGNPWNVKPSDDGKLPTILANSTLDHQTVAEIASGHRPFPNYSDIPLSPERRLLHEVIVQVVTERQLVGQDIADTHDKRLYAIVENVRHTPAYQQMQAMGEVNPEKVTALLDSLELKRLPAVAAQERTIVMMTTGGPATGKSALFTDLAKAHPETYRNSAIVNSDDYKPLLADPDVYGKGYANAAHAESAHLSDEILERLSRKMDTGRAPNVMLDIVTLSDQRMAFARKSGQLIVAAGTAPPDVTLGRSYQRGMETGRIVPSEAVLAGARAVSATTPRIFEHPNARMQLFDTDVPRNSPHQRVAQYEADTKTLTIYEPDIFVDFVERQHLNPKAQSAAELFLPGHRTPASIAHGMTAYTDRGVTLVFQNPQGELAMAMNHERVVTVRPLASPRGNAFFAELAGAATVLAGRHGVEAAHRAAVGEHGVADNAHGKRTQNAIPLIVPPNERAHTPPPVVVTRTAPQAVPESPERVNTPGKIGIAGAGAQLAIAPLFEVGITAANDGNARDIAKAGANGLANGILPGVTHGFTNITQNNQHQNWLDQTLNAGTTATQGVAVGALAVAGGSVAAAPVTGGASLTVTAGSLVVAGVSGIANLGIGLAHDAAYATGLSKQGGVITGLATMAGQLADSKAAHRAGDWLMGNDAKLQQGLSAKNIQASQLKPVDANHDGKVTAQETRDYLIQHHVPASQVNSLPAQGLADKLAATLSPEMQRALKAAAACDLSAAIRCDAPHQATPHIPSGLPQGLPRSDVAHQGR